MNIFNTIWLILNTRQRFYLFFIFASAFFVVFFEMLGITLLVPLVNMIINLDILDKYPLLNAFIRKISLTTSLNLFISALSLFLIFFTIRSVLLSITIFYSGKYSYLTGAEVSQKILSYFICQDFEKHSNTNSSVAVSLVRTEVAQFRSALQSAVNLLINIIVSFSILVFILFYFYKEVLGIFFIILLFILVYFFFINKFILSLSKRRLSAEANFIKFLLEIFNSYREIKIYKKEDFFLKNFQKNNLEVCEIGYKWSFIQSLPKIWIELVFLIIVYLIIIFSYIRSENLITSITSSSIIIFGALRILPSLALINGAFQNLKFNKISCEKIYSIIKQHADINNTFAEKKVNNYLSFINNIEIKNISFVYSGKKCKILKNVNLSIDKGEVVGITGSSGSGKTTFIEILMGFLDSYQGEILVDGIDIKTNYSLWQRNFSYVPQNIYLLDDSIKNNIVFGNENVDFSKIYKILDKIGLKQFVDNLPKGLDTEVGENAALLSGGQAQRIAIARALYNEPKILILDESTNSLDRDVEQDILKYIKNLSLNDKMTIIIISHNLEILKMCNKILKIQ
jgi:ABC-type multidrug transport system fused ATPase/permease subunit